MAKVSYVLKLVLNGDVDEFNAYREEHPDVEITLCDLYIDGTNLGGINFRDVDLSGTVFSNVNLAGADFTDADCKGATFDKKTVLSHAKFIGTNIAGVKMCDCIGVDVAVDTPVFGGTISIPARSVITIHEDGQSIHFAPVDATDFEKRSTFPTPRKTAEGHTLH